MTQVPAQVEMVYSFQNWFDILWEKNVLVIEKNFCNSRLKAKNMQEKLEKKSLNFLWMRKNLIGENNVFYCCPLSLQTLREKIRKSAVLQLTAAEIDTFSDASPQSPWYTHFKLPNKHIARIIKLHTVRPRDTQPQAVQTLIMHVFE